MLLSTFCLILIIDVTSGATSKTRHPFNSLVFANNKDGVLQGFDVPKYTVPDLILRPEYLYNNKLLVETKKVSNYIKLSSFTPKQQQPTNTMVKGYPVGSLNKFNNNTAIVNHQVIKEKISGGSSDALNLYYFGGQTTTTKAILSPKFDIPIHQYIPLSESLAKMRKYLEASQFPLPQGLFQKPKQKPIKISEEMLVKIEKILNRNLKPIKTFNLEGYVGVKGQKIATKIENNRNNKTKLVVDNNTKQAYIIKKSKKNKTSPIFINSPDKLFPLITISAPTPKPLIIDQQIKVQKPSNLKINRIIGLPTTKCFESSLSFKIKTLYPFTGNITSNNCSFPFNDGTLYTEVEINYNSCMIIKNQAQITINFERHNQSFIVRCHKEEETSLPLAASLEETEKVISFKSISPPPSISFHILKNNIPIKNSTLGEQLTLKWSIDSMTTHHFLLANCTISSPDHQLKYDLIDEKGCSVDHQILTNPFYNKEKTTATSSFNSFSIPDVSHIKFECNYKICLVFDEKCTKQLKVPPVCPDIHKVPNNSLVNN